VKPLLQVVAGTEYAPKAPTKIERRKVVREWRDAVAAKVKAGELPAIDCLMAEALTNFPSADHGYCWAGQKRLGDAIGRQVRAARDSIKRLRDAGLITVKRGGPGKTARWSFCINNIPIFDREPLKERHNSAQDRQPTAGLDRQPTAHKPFKQEHPCKQEPPPGPPAADEPDAMPDDVDTASAENGETPRDGLSGEVLAPGWCTFEQFWMASGQRGEIGPALAAWDRLAAADVAAIGDLILDQGAIDTGGAWACVWIKRRGWENPAMFRRPNRVADIAELLKDFNPKPDQVTVRRGTAEWDELVAWRRKQGDRPAAIEFMLTQHEWRAPAGWRPMRCMP
jgi:hypothetical protein